MNLHLFWRDPGAVRYFRTAVSLHGHTLYSREPLSFIPRIARCVPLLSRELDRQNNRYRNQHGRNLDFQQSWWTPPLAPLAALELERRQIETRLQLRPIVSLTDHDTMEGVAQLQVLHPLDRCPCSVEWTVPLGPSFLHVGVHNLPPDTAEEAMGAMADYTGKPRPERVEGLLEWFASYPGTLVVLNHPYWDEAAIGVDAHAAMAHDFLHRHRKWIHAVELNGLRPWRENRAVIRMAEDAGIAAISGGDRHGWEPNACVNLTGASRFSEFAAEVREGYSEVLLLPQYRQPHGWRVTQSLLQIVADMPDHTFGWRRWCDRCFYRTECGEARSLAQLWPNGGPLWVRGFIALTRLVRHPHLQPALRLAFGEVEECHL